MTRQPTANQPWARIPGVVYPGHSRWENVPGVEYPPKGLTQKEQEALYAKQNAEQKRIARERMSKIIIARYDAGNSARSIAGDLGISTDTAVKIIKASGRKIYKGFTPKTGRGGLSTVELRKQNAANRKADILRRVLSAYDNMPKSERSGAKVAAAAGIDARYACRLLKANGRKLSNRGMKPCRLLKSAA